MPEEVLTEPPAEEGNNQEAAEGTDEVSVTKSDLEDVEETNDESDSGAESDS